MKVPGVIFVKSKGVGHADHSRIFFDLSIFYKADCLVPIASRRDVYPECRGERKDYTLQVVGFNVSNAASVRTCGARRQLRQVYSCDYLRHCLRL